MSRAIVAGLISNSRAMPGSASTKTTGLISASQIWVHDRNPEKSAFFADVMDVNTTSGACELIGAIDVLIVAVKPQAMKELLLANAAAIQACKPLLISVAAGITAHSIQTWLNGPIAVVRAMPNTPSLLNEGATGLFANEHTSAAQRQLAESILATVGLCAWVPTDQDIDTVTALSGSGPAYFLRLMQALIKAAEKAGMSSDTAKQLALQTARGSALLASASDDSLNTLIDNIKSPKGTTEKALNTLNDAGFDDIVEAAFESARKRAEQLALELGD